MTDREALRLALEALIRADKISGYPNNKEAIKALRQALEQSAKERFCDNNCTWLDHHPACDKAEQPAQQEPGTWREVTYDQLMEEVRNRGYEIRNAKITVPDGKENT